MNTKTVTTVFFVVLLLFSISVPVSALSVYDIPIIKEIDLPEDLDFSIHDSCSGHAYFQQATADEAGNFAVFSLHYDVENLANTDFSKAYIDIYRSDGSFLQEVSFHTTFGFVVQLEGDVMRIYFYKSVLIYNISTQELHHYEIPARTDCNGGKKTFTAGEWTYTCKNGINGYVGLYRDNGHERQVLVEMPGAGQALVPLYLRGGAAAVVIALLTTYFKAKRRKKKGNKEITF